MLIQYSFIYEKNRAQMEVKVENDETMQNFAQLCADVVDGAVVCRRRAGSEETEAECRESDCESWENQDS